MIGSFLWQEFRVVVQTMRWEELAQDNSDERLSELEVGIEQICQLLDDYTESPTKQD